MSYLWIGLIGAATGWVGGQFVIGSREGIVIDVISGAIGAWLAVVLSRIVVPVAGSGALMSTIVAVVGAILTLLAVNRFMGPTLIPPRRSRRRM